MSRTPKEIIQAVQMAGVIGAGGGGFPSHVKLDAQVDTIIANGSECEPLLASDKTLVKERASRVVDGVNVAMLATGAKKGYIAVKGHYKDACAAVEAALPTDGTIKLHKLENYYPAGDEFLTVYDVTGRVIPEGGLPLHVGVVVSNVLSLVQMAEAVDGKPVTERILTITGSVHKPQVITVPIGATYRDLIQFAGGTINKTDILMDGGPMMGAIVKDWDMGIARTTSGIMALPEDHFVVRMNNVNISQMVKKSKAACCQCFRCTDLCPRYLAGHELYPHMTMRTIDYNSSEPTDHITSAFLCSQCGVCELIACDFMMLSPRKIYAEYRKLLVAKGVRNPHKRTGFPVREEYEYRKVPLPTVIKKLGLSEYVTKTPSLGYKEVDRVRVPMNRHAGAPALPKVVMGEKVKRGDIIASSPLDKLGTVCHASIAGKITEVESNYIEISK
jgi:cobalamin reductase